MQYACTWRHVLQIWYRSRRCTRRFRDGNQFTTVTFVLSRSAWLLPSGVQRVASRTGTGELIHSRMVGYSGRLLFVCLRWFLTDSTMGFISIKPRLRLVYTTPPIFKPRTPSNRKLSSTKLFLPGSMQWWLYCPYWRDETLWTWHVFLSDSRPVNLPPSNVPPSEIRV